MTTMTRSVLRGAGLPSVDLLRGSWEGHGIAYHNAGYNFPMQTQYGKAGFRCARVLE